MSGIKIIEGVVCSYCSERVEFLGNDNSRTFGHCLNCNRRNVFDGDLGLETIGDKSEVKSEAIKSDERPSDYHLLNIFAHKKYFDWYDVARAKRATGIIIDPTIEHVEKKLFVNDRGHKSYLQDLHESRNQIDMAIEEEELRLKNESD